MTHEKGLYVRAAIIINTLLIFLSTVVYKLIVGEHCITVATPDSAAQQILAYINSVRNYNR